MKVMACSPLSWWWVGLRYSRILGAGLEGYMLGFGLRCAWHRIEVMGKTTGRERKISAGGGRAAVRSAKTHHRRAHGTRNSAATGMHKRYIFVAWKRHAYMSGKTFRVIS